MARIVIDARKLRDLGIGTYLQNLLQGLAAIDVDDQFVVLLAPQQQLPFTSPRFETMPVRARNYGVAEHFTLPRLAKRVGCDLYHAPHYVLPWLAPQPCVVTIHDLIHLRMPEQNPNRAATVYARTVMERAFRRAACVLTVSDATKRDLLDTFGGSPERVVVIPNSVPDMFFRTLGDDQLESARERWSLRGRFILYAGNVKPHKNLERLLAAFAELKSESEMADVKLVLMGSQDNTYRGLRRMASERGIISSVRFLGWLTERDVSAVYQLASVFAYPSLLEGFGLPPLEAMASGVAVVASRTSSLPEVCGDAALLVDPTDVGQIADALRALLNDDELNAEMVKRGRIRAATYHVADQASRTLDVYHDVLERCA